MSRAGGNAHDATQPFLDERERGGADIDRGPRVCDAEETLECKSSPGRRPDRNSP
jgi:hypothetical protein